MAGRFDGKIVLLTGGASGIGRATAQRFARDGAHVVAVDIAETGLSETAELITGAGGAVTTHVADIADPTACRATVDTVVDAHGRLDVLANIAGVTRIHHFTDCTPEEFDLMWAVNARGPFFLCQAAVPHLLETAGGIVNVASNAGLMGAAYTVAYAASKGAIVQITRSLAMEYEKTRLRVIGVAPGGVRTPMTANIPIPDDVDFALMEGIMSKRGRCEPEDIANAITWVASDEASHMHGGILAVDDGLTAG